MLAPHGGGLDADSIQAVFRHAADDELFRISRPSFCWFSMADIQVLPIGRNHSVTHRAHVFLRVK